MQTFRLVLLVVPVVAIAGGSLLAPDAQALVLCAKAKKGEPRGPLKLRDECKRREIQIDPAALGLNGPTGPPGADGQLRIYGDGSAGARTVAADETLADVNLQYTDFAVAPGVTLTVPSGTVIRCSGAFTNEGTIVVEPGARGARRASRSGEIDSTLQEPHPGVSPAAAASGEFGPTGIFYFGGFAGAGLDETVARQLLRPGSFGGGGGGTGTFSGGDGGGSFTVLADGDLMNQGMVQADGTGGSTGGGGGGGGVVVLASRQTVTNAGSVMARGGNGGPSGSAYAPGGGGGGGIVHLIAPAVDDSGSQDAAGGAAGTIDGAPLAGILRFGGGGGGGGGGDGGSGGSVSSSGTMVLEAGAGIPGHMFGSAVDPTALF